MYSEHLHLGREIKIPTRKESSGWTRGRRRGDTSARIKKKGLQEYRFTSYITANKHAFTYDGCHPGSYGTTILQWGACLTLQKVWKTNATGDIRNLLEFLEKKPSHGRGEFLGMSHEWSFCEEFYLWVGILIWAEGNHQRRLKQQSQTKGLKHFRAMAGEGDLRFAQRGTPCGRVLTGDVDLSKDHGLNWERHDSLRYFVKISGWDFILDWKMFYSGVRREGVAKPHGIWEKDGLYTGGRKCFL